MNYSYTDRDYEITKEKIDAWLDQFDEEVDYFENAVKKKLNKQYSELKEQMKEYDNNETLEVLSDGLYYKLDDHEKEMVEQLAEKMNCSWQYVMTEALDWYYMAVMNGVVEGDNGEKEEVEEFNEVIEPDMVNRPHHYTSGKIETIDKIERVIHGLPAEAALRLGNVLRYFDRAGLKDDADQDLDKANNYAYRLVFDEWRDEVEDKRGKYIQIGGEDGIKIPFYK